MRIPVLQPNSGFKPPLRLNHSPETWIELSQSISNVCTNLPAATQALWTLRPDREAVYKHQATRVPEHFTASNRCVSKHETLSTQPWVGFQPCVINLSAQILCYRHRYWYRTLHQSAVVYQRAFPRLRFFCSSKEMLVDCEDDVTHISSGMDGLYKYDISIGTFDSIIYLIHIESTHCRPSALIVYQFGVSPGTTSRYAYSSVLVSPHGGWSECSRHGSHHLVW